MRRFLCFGSSETSAYVSNTRHGQVSGAAPGVSNVPRREWVIGLDFGTTYSGFAYSHRLTKDPTIHTYYDYPRSRPEKPYCKAPSSLYYSPDEYNNLKCSAWGYIARSSYMQTPEEYRHRDAYLTKFKLLLTRDLSDPNLVASIPSSLTPMAIITDYMRHIGEHALLQLRNHHAGGEQFGPHLVQWVVTVPSIWDENAKQQMKICMMNAGLVSDMDALLVVLEPEAASFHCHQILRNQNNVSLNRADKILVADVGGGTVDIVVQEMVGNGATYQVQELTESSGGLCGGTYVDDSFMRLAIDRIPYLDEYLKQQPSYKTHLLNEWEDIKCTFGDSLSNAYPIEIQLPYKLDNLSKLELTQQDLMFIFDPVVDNILTLIEKQLQQVPDIKVMFVVGGFAGSPYLMRRIRARFEAQGTHIVSPANPGAAIVQGAVSLAFHPEAIVSRIAKKTYGTSVTLPFEPYIDPPRLRIITNGEAYCMSRFEVFVRKGERVEINKRVTKNYVPHGADQRVMLFDLWSSTEQDPRYAEGSSATKEGEFSVSLPENYSLNGRQPEFDLSMFFGGTSIELAAATSGRRRVGSLVLPVRYCS